MDPHVIALVSNKRYFHGLCVVASALSRLDPIREVDSKVLDGGIFQTTKNLLSR